MARAKNCSFDLIEKYETEIAPLVANLVSECCGFKIPMFVTFAVKNDDGKTEFRTTSVSPAFVDKELSEDRIAKFEKVIKGYNVVHANDEIDLKPFEPN